MSFVLLGHLWQRSRVVRRVAEALRHRRRLVRRRERSTTQTSGRNRAASRRRRQQQPKRQRRFLVWHHLFDTRAYLEEFLGRCPNMRRFFCLFDVKMCDIIKVGLQSWTNLNEQGVGRWMCLNQPPKAPAQHVIQVGCLIRKVISVSMVDCSPTDLHDGETER